MHRSPAQARNEDHCNSSCARMLLHRSESRLRDVVRCLQIHREVERTAYLQADPGEQGLFPAQAVDDEEGTDERGNELHGDQRAALMSGKDAHLDDTVYTRGEKPRVTGDTDEGEKLGSESSESASTSPEDCFRLVLPVHQSALPLAGSAKAEGQQ